MHACIIKSIFNEEDEKHLIEECNIECIDLWSQLLGHGENVLEMHALKKHKKYTKLR